MPSFDVATADLHPPGDKNSDDGDPDSTISEVNIFEPYFEAYEFEFPEFAPCCGAWQAARDFSLLGYAHVRPEDYDRSQFDDGHELKRAFAESLQVDTEPGNRWRSYSAFELRGRTATLLPTTPYMQTRQYNTDDGDKLRQFAPIDRRVLMSRTLRELIRFNITIARLTNQTLFHGESVLVGVHMISYRAAGQDITFSSPVWLHRDQEEYVAVILYELSHNLNGGENILANGPRELAAKIAMNEEFEAILLSKKGMHAVVPMNSSNGRPAFRNVVLITLTSTGH